jgi:hypothetical protein
MARDRASDAGFDSNLDSRLDKLIADKRAWGLHGVLVARGGQGCFARSSFPDV